MDAPYTTLKTGNGLFVKIWNTNLEFIPPSFKRSILPGSKNGVSASTIGGYNIGISKYSLPENMKAALVVLTFMTSKEVQRKVVMIGKVLSGITSLYDEKEICDIMDCELLKNLQFINRPTSKSNDYYNYSENFRNNLYKYLYGNGNVTAAEVLKETDDITRIYYVSLDSKTSSIGIILLSIFITIALLFLLSLFLLYSKTFKHLFSHLPKDFWLLIIIGLDMEIAMSYLEIVQKTTAVCYVKHVLLLFGFSLTFTPILYKLIIEFPLENKYSIWIKQHRYLFIILFLAIELFFSLMLIIGKYDVETIKDKNGKNYQTCSFRKSFGNTLNTIEIIYSILTILCMAFFIYIEWNLELAFNDVRSLSVVCGINIIIMVLFSIMKIINIQHYKVYFVIKESIYWLYILSNYFLIYFAKIVLPYLTDKKQQERNSFLKENLKNSQSNGTEGKSFSIATTSKSKVSNIVEIIVKLHNSSGKENSTIIKSSVISDTSEYSSFSK